MSRSAENQPDWPFIRDGAVSLYWSLAVFDAAKASLAKADYRLVEVDCETVHGFQVALGTGLDWPGQFGYQPWSGNLDALVDGLRDPPFSAKGRLALCFKGYHRLVQADRDYALSMLDVLEGSGRDRLVEGRRLLTLVQTDDAGFETPLLGGRRAFWNGAEWFTSARGLT